MPLHVRAVSPSPVRVKDSRRELGRQIQFHEPGVARGNTPNKRFWRAAFATFPYGADKAVGELMGACLSTTPIRLDAVGFAVVAAFADRLGRPSSPAALNGL